MKIIGHMNAAAALRENQEEYAPEKGVVFADLVELVKSTYSFQTFPSAAPGHPLLPTLTFQGGRFGSGPDSFAITLLVMEAEGDVVLTTTTDQGDLVLNSLVTLLDEKLEYRLAGAIKRRSYISNIVVEFDEGLELYIQKLSAIAEAINRARPKLPEFNLKRLAFGGPNWIPATDQVTTIESAEFLIERRAGTPFGENRFYSSAPMNTADHIRVLTEIEEIARAKAN